MFWEEGQSRYESVDRSPEVFSCDSRLVPPVVVDSAPIDQFPFRATSLLNFALHAR